MRFRNLANIFLLNNSILSVCVALLLSLTSLTAIAGSLPVQDSSGATFEFSDFELIQDATYRLDPKRILQEYRMGHSRQEPTINGSLAVKHTNYWTKFSISVQDSSGQPEPKKRIFSTEGLGAHRYALYELSADGIEPVKQLQPWEYVLSLEPGKTHTFLLRLTSYGTARQIYCKLWLVEDYIKSRTIQYHFLGLYFGLVLAMLLYNAAIYIFNKDRLYLYYSAFIVMLLFATLTITGFGVRFVWREMYGLEEYIYSTMGFLVLICCALFTRVYINIDKYSRVLDQYNVVCIYITLLVGCINLTSLNEYLVEFIYSWSMIAVLNLGVSAFYCWFKGSKNAGIYLFSFTGILFASAIWLLGMQGYLEPSVLLDMCIPLGSGFQLLTLSIALAEKIKGERVLKESSQRELIGLQEEAFKIQRERELFLKSSKEKYQMLYENNLDGLFHCDSAGVILEGNPAFKAMVGLDESSDFELTYLSLFDILFEADKAAITHFMASSIDASESSDHYQMENKFRRNDHSWFWASITLQHNKTVGNVSYIEGAIRDISERKAKEQIKIEKEAAVQSAKTKGAFLATIGQEIQSPLVNIIGFSQALFAGELPQALSNQCIKSIIDSGHHLLDVVDDMLDLAKVEGRQMEIEYAEVDLFALLNEIVAYFNLQAEESGLYFSLQYHYPLPQKICSDAVRLKQILIYLCRNAFEYTQKGSIIIGVRADYNLNAVVFSVFDTGRGIDQQTQTTLFNIPNKVDSAFAEDESESGFDLSIAKQLVIRLGGELTFKSALGYGTAFELQVAGGNLKKWPRVISNTTLPVFDTRSMLIETPVYSGSVLLVDGNQDIRDLIALLLQQTGVQVKLAISGSEALALSKQYKFNLILLDILKTEMMTELDGIETAKLIIAAGVTTPIVACTTYIMPDDLLRYERAGFTGFVAKPINRLKLYECLGQHLDKR